MLRLFPSADSGNVGFVLICYLRFKAQRSDPPSASILHLKPHRTSCFSANQSSTCQD
ncbi:Hypothetical predicted protein [Scomber scombrus]|uniref:Uncharacterized protein n=1 Tax=Scomber scombrus TaxID=13677 RepID=A0AAV1Q4X6_SCOSC